MNTQRYLLSVTLAATLGGLLFGYDTAVISGAIKSLKEYFELDAAGEGWAVSSALLGCVAGALPAGWISRVFGRKMGLALSALLFLVSALGSALAGSLNGFVVYRIIGGLGVGLASMIAPMYIAEVAPAERRGRLVSLYQLAIVTGIALVFFVNYFIALQGDDQWNRDWGWRWMLGSETLPAGLFLAFSFWIPESPRWLVAQGRHDKALEVLTRLNGPETARQVLAQIEQTLDSRLPKFRDLLAPAAWLALLVGMGLSALQQVTGINAIMYYAPKIFENFGAGRDAALLQNTLVGLVNLAFTFVAIKTIDQYGRKALLLVGGAGMVLGLGVVGLGLFLQNQGIWLLPFVLLYIASFAMSWGPVVWVLLSEIFDNHVRSLALSIAVFVQWAFNFLVSQTFPMLVDSPALNERFHGAFPFWLYGFMGLVALWFVWRRVPETKNKTLEEMQQIWKR